jgi:15-cis-phytoene synthase
VTSPLAASFAFCRRIARTRARNFYYSFVLLKPARKDAMCAMYAFMRFCDDLSDDPAQSDPATAIARWREELTRALEGRFSDNPIWPAFHDSVRRYNIPHQYFFDMIEGVGSDVQPCRMETFDELYRYCYQVASVVGLTTVHIFGFKSPDALPLAEKCGIAFQLTNILRDVAEDAAAGRVYLPAEDLRRFGAEVTRRDPAFLKLMRFESDRAKAYYAESAPLVAMIDPESQAALWALIEIYRRLLARIERSDFDVLERRIRVPMWEKVWILVRSARGARLRRAAFTIM